MAVLAMTLLVLGLPWADCACRNRLLLEGGQVYRDFAGLPGTIGVAYEDSNGYRLFAIKDGTVSEADDLPRKYEDAGVPALAPWPAWLKKAHRPYRFEGMSIGAPYATSPDGRFLAVGAADEDKHFEYLMKHEGRLWYALAYDPYAFMIIDLEERRSIALVDSEFKWGIEAVSWSPDSRYLAVLRIQGRQGYCLPEIVFLVTIGYGSHVIDHYLDIYDLQGRLMASRKLLSRNYDWRTEIVWLDKLPSREIHRVGLDREDGGAG